MAGFNVEQVLANNPYYIGPAGTPVPTTTTGPFGLQMRPPAMTAPAPPPKPGAAPAAAPRPQPIATSTPAAPSGPARPQRLDVGGFQQSLRGAPSSQPAQTTQPMATQQTADLSRFKSILGGTGSDGAA